MPAYRESPDRVPLGDVLNVLVDGKDQASPGSAVSRVGKPLPAGIHRDEHLSGSPAQFIVERCSMPSAPNLPSRGSHYLRRQIARG